MTHSLRLCLCLILAGFTFSCSTPPDTSSIPETVAKPKAESGPRTDVIYEVVTPDQFVGLGGAFVHSSFESPTKGNVPYAVYLPPSWKYRDTTQSFPLVIHLYGQGGNEYNFVYSVRNADVVNNWIRQDEIPPMVVICVKGHPTHRKIQWYTSDNEILLTSTDVGELRDYAHKTFGTSMDADKISVQGQSRGAAGTIHFALKYSDDFASAVACAYVSDYTLGSFKNMAKRNKKRIISNDIKLRMEIGTNDYWVINYKRTASPRMHSYLDNLGIAHEYDTLSGCQHGYHNFWKHTKVDQTHLNGLNHLKFHADAWAKNDTIPTDTIVEP